MMHETPVTNRGLEQYDQLSPEEAILRAWVNPGSHPEWHQYMRAKVRHSMPVLTRALDRLERQATRDRS